VWFSAGTARTGRGEPLACGRPLRANGEDGDGDGDGAAEGAAEGASAAGPAPARRGLTAHAAARTTRETMGALFMICESSSSASVLENGERPR
jgi:hypothetical protein